MIRERHLAEEFPVVVGVERRPAAVARLHGQQPVQAALGSACCAAGLAGAHFAERQHHHRGVVDIRIEFVGVFEGPAGRLGVGALHAPIALAADFLVEQPIRRRRSDCVLGIGLRQGVSADRRVPHRREAGLEEEAVAIIHHQVVEVAQRFHAQRIVLGEAQDIQRHHRVHHRRIDRAQPVGVVQALDHPVLGLLDGAAAHRLAAAALPPLQQLVHA